MSTSSAIRTVALPSDEMFRVTPGITSVMLLVVRVIVPIPVMTISASSAASSLCATKLVSAAPIAV